MINNLSEASQKLLNEFDSCTRLKGYVDLTQLQIIGENKIEINYNESKRALIDKIIWLEQFEWKP